MRSIYITVAISIVSAVLAFPLLAISLSMIAGYTIDLKDIFDLRNIYSTIRIASILLSTIFIILAVLTINSILYVIALISHVVIGNYEVLLSPIYLLPIIFYGLLKVLSEGWRRDQVKSINISISGLLLTIVSLIVIISSAIILSYYIGSIIWGYIIAIRSINIDVLVLRSLADFLTINPLGSTILVGLSIVGFYVLFREFAEILVLYINPSRQVALNALKSIDFDVPFKPPLSSLRNMIISLSIAPPFYYLIAQTLDRFNLMPESLVASILFKWLLSVLVLTILWIIVSKLLTRLDESDPSLLSIASGLILILLLYSLVYILGLWDPRAESLSLENVDLYLKRVIFNYYSTLFSIVELILILLGVAP
ncbi:MAG: hypothetical protein QXE99_00800 [Acidilobaceae archaeon]